MTEKEIQEVCYIVALLDEATERINALIGAANARNAVAEYRRTANLDLDKHFFNLLNERFFGNNFFVHIIIVFALWDWIGRNLSRGR